MAHKNKQFIRLGMVVLNIAFWPAFMFHKGLKNWSEKVSPSWVDENAIIERKNSEQKVIEGQANCIKTLETISSFKSGQVFTNCDYIENSSEKLSITALIQGSSIFIIEQIQIDEKKSIQKNGEPYYKLHILTDVLSNKESICQQLSKLILAGTEEGQIFQIIKGLEALENVKPTHLMKVGGMTFNCQHDISTFKAALKKLNSSNCTRAGNQMNKNNSSNASALQELLNSVEITLEREELKKSITAYNQSAEIDKPKTKFKL